MKPWLAAAALLWLPAAAGAAIRLEPGAMFFTVQAGQPAAQALTIRNDADVPLTLVAEPEFWVRDHVSESAGTWLKVSPATLTLEPKSRRTVTVEVDGKGSFAGEALVMLFFAEPPLAGMHAAMIRMQVRSGIPVYVRRSGTERLRAAIARFEHVQTGPDEDVRFDVDVVNQGNIHVAPLGVVQLFPEGTAGDRDERLSREMRFARPIFPGQTGTAQVVFPRGGIPEGRYRARLDVYLQTLYPGGQAGDLAVISQECLLRIATRQR